MSEGDAGSLVRLEGSLRNSAKPRKIICCEFVVSPGGGGSRDGIEPESRSKAATDAVVVSAHVELASRADQIDDFVGTGAVADYVTEVPQNSNGAAARGRRLVLRGCRGYRRGSGRAFSQCWY